MMKGFTNILVPIFPFINARVAFRRALKMCDVHSSVIHLVTVQNAFLSSLDNLFHYSVFAATKLQSEWQNLITFNKGVQVEFEYERGTSINNAIKMKASKQKADLIIIGSHPVTLLPGFDSLCTQLTELPKCTVLKINKGVHDQTTVVVPVNQGVASSTVEKINMIKARLEITVHLLQCCKNGLGNDETASVEILETYQNIISMNCPVQYSVTRGNSKLKAIRNYVKEIDNDYLMINT